jgi:hypothetical protein
MGARQVFLPWIIVKDRRKQNYGAFAEGYVERYHF